jgi:hypothetical protein
VPKCLACNTDPVAHRFAQVASIPCNEETKPLLMALFHHVKNHEWEPLKDFKEFRADQDDAIVYAITGPHEGGMVVLPRDPFELCARVEIYLEEINTTEEVERIKALVAPGDWQELRLAGWSEREKEAGTTRNRALCQVDCSMPPGPCGGRLAIELGGSQTERPPSKHAPARLSPDPDLFQ